jgi:hypothetical protein
MDKVGFSGEANLAQMDFGRKDIGLPEKLGVTMGVIRS